MKLLVLAQTPPPLHGQSMMVQAMIAGLPGLGVPVHHVNLRLSRDAADIGRWRAGKVAITLKCAFQAIAARYRHGCDTLYYVPAPPEKRGALYRDWLLMALCRVFFSRVILHWHAPGLGEWLTDKANCVERIITRRLLGRADVAVVLAEALREDAATFAPRRLAVVPNGIGDPGPLPPPPSNGPLRLLFLGLCSEKKGLFAAAEAVLEANRRTDSPAQDPGFVLTAAGPFEELSVARRFTAWCAQHSECLSHKGIVGTEEKRRLFAEAHALLFPTTYSAEGMPLVALEALAHDRAIIANRWRGLPEIVSGSAGILVPPHDRDALVRALLELRAMTRPKGVCRARFEKYFTLSSHLSHLAQALAQDT